MISSKTDSCFACTKNIYELDILLFLKEVRKVTGVPLARFPVSLSTPRQL